MKELSTRAAQLVAATAERAGLGAAFDLTTPTLERALRADVPRSADKLLARFRSDESIARAFPALRDAAATAAVVRQRCPAHATETIAAADRVISGRFDLLGHEGLDFGTPIDWQRDPLTGLSAPLIPWSALPYFESALFGDHKVIWELNRQQYLVTLGQAYAYTGDERYARAFSEHVLSWIAANPPKRGINWASSLEVALRALSWLWALHLFRDSGALTPTLYARMLGVLHMHGRHLETYLSTYFSPNTHLTGEALGLVQLGLLLPELRRADRWVTLGRSVLETQLDRHVRPDGVYFEQASLYHRYTTELYLHLLLLAEQNRMDLRAPVRERLDALFEHLLFLTRPDGTVPLLGDDDGGRLVQLDRRRPSDVRALLATGAVVLRRGDLAFAGRDDVAAALWLLGPEALERFDDLVPRPPTITTHAFPHGGFFVIRDSWNLDATWGLVDCGPHGAMNCGHAHADALSLELGIAGQPVLVDTGTFTYSGPERNAFRATAAHNAVVVGRMSSSEPTTPFAWGAVASSQLNRWIVTPRFTAFAGCHDGYARLTPPATCRREVLAIRGDYWVVRDVVGSTGDHEVAVHWHAAPGLPVRAVRRDANSGSATRADLFDPNGKTLLHILAVGQGGTLSVESGWVSPTYGRKEPGAVLIYRQRLAGVHEIITYLLPHRWGGLGAVAQQAAGVLGGSAVILNYSDGQDWLLFGAGTSVQCGDVETDAVCLWLRRAARDGAVREFVALEASRAAVAGRELFSAAGRRPWHAWPAADESGVL